MLKVLKPLVHLLVPLCVHLIADAMTKSVLVDVTTSALCHGKSSCSQAIYINGLQQTVDGIFKMVVVPILGQLADDYGRKPILLLTVSTTIFPYILLAISQSRGFVYAFYVVHTLSNIISRHGNIFCISYAYAADVTDQRKKAIVFSWMTGFFSASDILGNVLARFLPEKYIFEVAIGLSIFTPVYMVLYLVETVKPINGVNQCPPNVNKAKKFLWERYDSMKRAIMIVIHSPILKCITLISFFFKLGMSSIDAVLLYYLKAVFGFKKNQLSEVLMVVGVGSVVSQMVVLPLIYPFVGEKLMFCIALLSSIAYALLYGLAWAPWVAYLSASLGVIFVLFTPASYAMISQAISSTDQGKVLALVDGVKAIAIFLSPIGMSPLTAWFLSENAPFNCKGFSFICASLCLVVALCYACALPKQVPLEKASEDEIERIEAPVLSSQ
ncbi:unnamed protein product [Cuscuta epithymum]|uniref:Major facilitator superfamily (MFS) profile domain-containing protein n=1 Tax=Cuscuta epithymum TaxID=186058 RepID=A0AAV0DS93_9ASTE|nr:unnamed protein product [Cuscuta epithymum]